MSSLSVIEELINVFSKWKCANILYEIDCIHNIHIDANIKKTQVIIHEQISINIAKIKSILSASDIHCDIDINSIHRHIYKLLVKYYNIIMCMPSNLRCKSECDDDSNQPTTIQQVIDSKVEWINDIKWQIFLEIIENLMSYLFEHGLIQSNLVWNDIIKRLILQNIKVQTKRKIITLCRILISFGSKFIASCNDKTLIMHCKNCLNEFLIHFVSTNYRRYDKYNDLHTLQDIDIVFDLFYHHQQRQNTKQKKGKRRGRRKKKKNKDDDDSKGDINSNQNNDSVLSTQIEDYYNKTRVKAKERQNKHGLLSHIGKLWKKVLFAGLPSLKTQIHYKSFDGSKHVHLFGSSATKLDESGADIDLYLTIPNHVTLSLPGEWQLFQRLSEELQTSKYKNNNQNGFNVINIFETTVPIIKLYDESNDIRCDISFGKQIENRSNVELLNKICDYNKDKRIRELIIAIKNWSRNRDLNDASRNRLNSFGFVLLVIHYLQHVKILPMLKKKKNGYYGNQMVELMERKNNNKSNQLYLGDLLIGFFEYYADFNFMEYSISLFKSKVKKINRYYTDLNGKRLKDNQLIFVIEDPIQTNYNSAKNIRYYSANLMRIEFLRGKLILKYGSTNFNDLCKQLL